MNIRAKIWRELKKKNGQTFAELAFATGGDIEFNEEVLRLIMSGYLIPIDDKVYIRNFIDKPEPKVFENYFHYEDIARVAGPLEPIPISWMNPLIALVAHKYQGRRGTCCGQSGGYWRELTYMALTGDYPTDAEKAGLRRDVFDAVLHDILYVNHSFSAEGLYRKSKEYDPVLQKIEGSYTWLIARALKEWGACLERQWPTAKDYRASWITPPPENAAEIETFAKAHRIDAYATITTADAVKRAIFKHRAVLGSIMLYENYINGQSDGRFPDPRGPEIGGHALCFVGYDENYLYFLHSWEGWPLIGSISIDYFNRAQINFLTMLDAEEKRIAIEEVYGYVNVKSNMKDVPLYVGAEQVGVIPMKLRQRISDTLMLRAICEYELQQMVTITPEEQEVVFKFNPFRVLILRLLKRRKK